MRAVPLLFRRGSVLIVVLALVSLMLLQVDRRLPVNPLRDATAFALAPVQAGLQQVSQGLSAFFSHFGDIAALRRENEQLRAQIEHLTAENAQVQSLRQQNERLRQQLAFKEARPELEQLPAEVVYRDPSSLRKYLVIDRGRRDGVEPGMAVVSPGGLVGRVQSVDDRRARVLLLIDSTSAVRAYVQDAGGGVNGRADGIVYGRWPHGRLRMSYLDTTARITEGAWVMTSGMDDELPRDLPIGIIQTIDKSDVQDTQQAEILPIVDPDTLESVAVILRAR